ncbi:HAMP domain-containing sensor histidine kinase [Moritella sp.]|uniref:sensor histidine kinase n=1 Tax=Moritella sp. TaxID=78556 RepID=UPI001DCB2E48|nr:HAMP domain-containing sensor histidine kinase [Moritella sp.]MCJ8349429.1 cache domain-containing protein [Moritella sp.]NQZ39255.1 cache domain-containing protein [Moritella sp.]
MNMKQYVLLWIKRFRTMVRYRLLVLTSVPIVITLFALFALAMYWTVTYTWQNALTNVKSDLTVAHNSIELLQKEQRMQLTSLSSSYEFQRLLRTDEAKLPEWVKHQAENYALDFVVLHPASDFDDFPLINQQLLLTEKPQTFFQVLNNQALQRLNSSLPIAAQIPLLGEKKFESRGLVSRNLLPVFNRENKLEWIMDGGILLNNSTQVVDRIRDLIYSSGTLPVDSIGTVTLFMDDIRVSTNVPLDSDPLNGRAIGTRVSQEVKQQVLIAGENWVGRAFVYDDWYISAYEPLRNYNGNVIGMLYTGYLEWPLIATFLTNIVEFSIGIVAVLLLSGGLVYRGARDLFRPIEKIHDVVRVVPLGLNRRIGDLGLCKDHELAIFGQQFDSMLDQLQQRNDLIKRASLELEDKVHSRTQSLHDKTQELEQYIKLLNQTRSKLVMSEKLAALGELTAGIAHEINNPTAVILGNVELLQLELGEDSQRVTEELEAIHEQIDRIRNITRSLLQYSRQGGVQDEITWQHLNLIVKESLTLVSSGTKSADVQIESQLDAKCCVEVNRHQLLQVLVNLQMNGVHAMDDKGLLKIKTEDWRDDDDNVIGAVVHICDHGCGISEDNLARIFDPFFTTRRSGTGLGLSVSQSIISEVGGKITVQSELGLGSTFSIYLHEKAVVDNDLLLSVEVC